ncbi:MAG: electron transfer flavoprotein subunit alpha/FixB family protein [Thermoleophilia bacterium]|nr:electron transfer flavoprotein subunit alpha/FixB family protein [Thermoleophilia bacterium]
MVVHAGSGGRTGADAYENVLVCGEVEDGRITSLTLELLGIGARLAGELRRDLQLVHLGAGIPPGLGEAHGYGAQGVYAAADPLLGTYQPDLYLQAMEQIVDQLRPRIVLFGQTDLGSDLAPRLAFRLRTGVTLDCVDLVIDEETGLLEQVKPVFGGKALATFSCDARPQIVSVRQGSFAPAVCAGAATGEVTPLGLALDISRARTRLVEKVQDETLALALNLASASAVVSGGRGLRDQEGVALISETANLLGGTIGATRAAVDEGLLPRSILVGLTGRRVNPRLYVAVGMSGSLHHMAGCMRSGTIVAVNSDDSAPIFTFSHIGVVGDLREVLEAFNDEIGKIAEERR